MEFCLALLCFVYMATSYSCTGLVEQPTNAHNCRERSVNAGTWDNIGSTVTHEMVKHIIIDTIHYDL
jgi:hypothetical protein